MIKEILTPKVKDPVVFIAWPGMGEVAHKSVLFLKEVMGFKIFARLEASDFFKPAGITVDKGILGLPSMPAGFFYFCKPKKGPDIILFLGEAQPPLDCAQGLAKIIIRFLKKYKPQMLFSFAAKPDAIDHKAEPGLWIAATHKELLSNFKKFNLKILQEGQISGLNGLILGVAKKARIKGICLLAEIPFYTVQIENPRANIGILKVLSEYFDLDLNLKPLLERCKFIEQEIDKLMSYLKGETDSPPPLNQEDIEKIKKDLSAYTKLPQSMIEKIESLFKGASKELSKASELKQELDHWNVYKDYEDRFLDLFKKDKREETN